MLKKLLPACAVALAVFLSSCGETEKVEKPYNQGINITPVPVEMVQNDGVFGLNKKVVFTVNDPSLETVTSYFSSKIAKSTGFTLGLQGSQPSSGYISLNLDKNIPVNDEGYVLEVTEKGVKIEAKTPQGAFYGMQTVMQLLPAEIESDNLINNIAWNIPAVKIKDEPRFGYRGLMLDVCRHFTNVEDLKKQLDVLAMFKINKFHWHLTDDQGWRVEIKKYPKLAQISSTRIEGEGNEYGPFIYTHDQVKDVVAYAKERFIEVIPEIELPGHAVAALAAYPEFSCTGGPFEVRNIWGIANDVYCAGNDSVFQFLEDVFTEIMPLFESDYVHIGGDECPKIRWEKCPKCQARIKSLGLKGDKEHSAEEKLQSYFVQRIEKFLVANNKKMIGWDEILEGGLAPSATVMSWRGEEGGVAAANMGHDVIMTPSPWLYLDKYQGDDNLLPVTIGGYLALEKVYLYEPIPEKIDEDKKQHILGAQANAWNEYKYNLDVRELDIYPRIIALSELTWSPKERKDYKDFERRIENQRVRLDMHSINYYIPMPEDKNAPSCNFQAFTDNVTLEFKSTEPVKIVYTTDGSEPALDSPAYSEPLTFADNATVKVRSILLSEKMSPVRTILLEKQTYTPAVERSAGEKIGLKAEYFKGVARRVVELDGKTPDEIEYVPSPQKSKFRVPGYREVYPEDFCSTILTGYINIPEDGVYYFDTDAEMWLDGELFITNEGAEGTARRFSRADKSAALAKGLHPVKIVRLGAIFGGWPTQWENIWVSIRPEKESKFKAMDESYFL